MTEIRLATSDEQIHACYPVMSQLRPHLGPEQFLPRVRRQEQDGYRLAFIELHGVPVTVAGYRILHQLAGGRVFYVDDLVTDEARRSAGFGARMLRWLLEQAKREGCDSFDLDSAIHRENAHRFYEREGMRPASYHFKKKINPQS